MLRLRPFHNLLPKSSACGYWILLENYETACIINKSLVIYIILSLKKYPGILKMVMFNWFGYLMYIFMNSSILQDWHFRLKTLHFLSYLNSYVPTVPQKWLDQLIVTLYVSIPLYTISWSVPFSWHIFYNTINFNILYRKVVHLCTVFRLRILK